MSNPRPSSRIGSLEKRATDIEAEIVELANDQAESNKVLFRHMQKGFDQAHSYIKENIEAVMATKEDIKTLATKDDIARLESDITSIKSTQEQILELLQQKGE